MTTQIVIGILGGIGSGKSTVASAFSDMGCMVIDADEIAHEVLKRPDICSQLVFRWGKGIIKANGDLNRVKIAERVFHSKEELEFLNSLIHPHVLTRCKQLLNDYLNNPKKPVIVLDMPLLMEVGWEKKCNYLIFIECSDEKRWAWLQKNGKFDLNQLKKRENFQISLDKKRQIAHYIIHNNSDKSDIAEQVAQIFSSIKGSK